MRQQEIESVRLAVNFTGAKAGSELHMDEFGMYLAPNDFPIVHKQDLNLFKKHGLIDIEYKPDCVLEQGEKMPTETITISRELWERVCMVVKAVARSRLGSLGSVENVYCPSPMNRHGIDNIIKEIDDANAS